MDVKLRNLTKFLDKTKDSMKKEHFLSPRVDSFIAGKLHPKLNCNDACSCCNIRAYGLRNLLTCAMKW